LGLLERDLHRALNGAWIDNVWASGFPLGVYEVAGIGLRIVLDVAVHHGLSPVELLQGLGVTEDELRQGQRRRYPWATYAEMLDRVAAVLGVENMATAGEGVPAAFPEGVAIASAFVSPGLLYRFVNLVLQPALFPMFHTSVVDRPDDRLVLTWELLPGYRESKAVFYASVGATRVLPTAIGLPPARVELLEVTGTRGVYLVELPKSRTLLARARRHASETFSDQALREMELDKTELRESFTKLQTVVRELEAREEALSKEVEARSHLQSSLTKVLDTVSNAAFLVSDAFVVPANAAGALALERRGEPLRGELLAAVKQGHAPGLDLTPTGAPGQVLVIRRGLRDELDRRLIEAAQRWGLTPRQTEVLESLVDGLSNGEVAERLGCTARTVEVHVTSILDRADAGSRLQLVAAFWGDL
jgi:DNA-binding CsgD family transcriptional regulator